MTGLPYPLTARVLEAAVARARLQKWLDRQVSPFARRCRSDASLLYATSSDTTSVLPLPPRRSRLPATAARVALEPRNPPASKYPAPAGPVRQAS